MAYKIEFEEKAFDYILSEIEDGNIELRESGFRKTLLSRVGR